MIKFFPTRVLGLDEYTGSEWFVLDADDGTCASLEIKIAIDNKSWPEVSKAITEALKQMNLKD